MEAKMQLEKDGEILFDHLRKNGLLSAIEKNTDNHDPGILMACGDGHRDIINFHKSHIHPRTTVLALPGGPLNFSRSFCEELINLQSGNIRYRKRELFSELAIQNALAQLRLYMGAKKTKRIFLNFHYPCGAAEAMGITFWDLISNHLPEVANFIRYTCTHNQNEFCWSEIEWHVHYQHQTPDSINENTYRLRIEEFINRIAKIQINTREKDAVASLY